MLLQIDNRLTRAEFERRYEATQKNSKYAQAIAFVKDAPEFYLDGSGPSKPLQDLITRSSLAVPIKTVVQLAPKFVSPTPDQGVNTVKLDSV